MMMDQSHEEVPPPARSWKRRLHFWSMNFLAVAQLASILTLKPILVAAAFVADRPFSFEACTNGDDAQSDACKQARSQAALWIGLAAFANSALGMIFGPVCGAWGDMYGRRWLLIFTMQLMALNVAALLLTSFSPGFVWLFLVAEAANGLCPYITVMFAVIADESLPSQRPAAFGVFQAVFGGSVVVGPMASLLLSIRSACVLALLAILAGLALAVFYPETSPGVRRTPSLIEEDTAATPSRIRSWLGVGPRDLAQADRQGDAVLRPDAVVRLLCSSALLRRLSVCVLVSSTVFAMQQAVGFLFWQSQLDASREMSTWYIITIGLSGLFVAFFILKLMVKSFGMRRTLLVGLVFQLICVLLNTMTDFVASVTARRVLALIPCILTGFAGMNFPMVAAMKSNAVSAEMQGRIQGAIGSLQYSALALGPLIGGGTFSFFSQAHPSLGLTRPFFAAPYAVSALFMPIAIVAAAALPSAAENVEGAAEQQDSVFKEDESPEQDTRQGA